MKKAACLASFLLCLAVLPGHAETRVLKLRIEPSSNPAVVSITSAVASENRTQTSISDAAEVLKNAVGWGSVILVILDTGGAR